MQEQDKKIEQLEIAFQEGEEKAFDHFFRQYFAALVTFARNYLADEEQCRDLVQDCFIRLWENHAIMDKQDRIRSFLYTVVRNKCIDAIRRSKVHTAREAKFNYLADQWEPEEVDNLIRVETMNQLYASIDELPEQTRRVFKLFYIEGKKNDEIAKLLNVSYDFVRQLRARGIKTLKKRLLPVFLIIFFSLIF